MSEVLIVVLASSSINCKLEKMQRNIAINQQIIDLMETVNDKLKKNKE